ncbi:MAG: hypothetical protein WDM78_19885 [Puia sp.]
MLTAPCGLVRSMAKEWKIDTARIGMLGFSAGGEVVDAIAFGSGKGDPKATDPIDQLNGRRILSCKSTPAPSLYLRVFRQMLLPRF